MDKLWKNKNKIRFNQKKKKNYNDFQHLENRKKDEGIAFFGCETWSIGEVEWMIIRDLWIMIKNVENQMGK